MNLVCWTLRKTKPLISFVSRIKTNEGVETQETGSLFWFTLNPALLGCWLENTVTKNRRQFYRIFEKLKYNGRPAQRRGLDRIYRSKGVYFVFRLEATRVLLPRRFIFTAVSPKASVRDGKEAKHKIRQYIRRVNFRGQVRLLRLSVYVKHGRRHT